jgi:hypothetical protein
MTFLDLSAQAKKYLTRLAKDAKLQDAAPKGHCCGAM